MKSSGSKKKTLGDLCFVLEILVTRRKWEVEMCVEKENLVLGVCMGKNVGFASGIGSAKAGKHMRKNFNYESFLSNI